MTLNISKTVHHGVHFIADNLLKVALNTIKTGHTLSIITDTLLKVALNISKQFTMVYISLADNLLKVALNTNKTGHHVIHHNWHIVESDIKHQ